MIITVEFEPNGKRYDYQSPILLQVHDLVIVNVYGKLVLAKVVDIPKYPTHEETLRSIVGRGYMLEDLCSQPEPQPTLLQRVFNYANMPTT